MASLSNVSPPGLPAHGDHPSMSSICRDRSCSLVIPHCWVIHFINSLAVEKHPTIVFFSLFFIMFVVFCYEMMQQLFLAFTAF